MEEPNAVLLKYSLRPIYSNHLVPVYITLSIIFYNTMKSWMSKLLLHCLGIFVRVQGDGSAKRVLTRAAGDDELARSRRGVHEPPGRRG